MHAVNCQSSNASIDKKSKTTATEFWDCRVRNLKAAIAAHVTVSAIAAAAAANSLVINLL
jgi:hypothetical protein